jgi:hypothetical protein
MKNIIIDMKVTLKSSLVYSEYIVIRFSFQANWKNIQEVSKKTVNDISQ